FEHGRGRYAELGAVGAVLESQIGMCPYAIRTRLGTDVRGLDPDGEAVCRERVLDAQRKREGVARSGPEQELEHHPVGRALGDGPFRPPDEAVDRVSPLGLVQGQLMAPPVELVAAVRDPVRPRNEQLTSAERTKLVLVVAVEDLASTGFVAPETAAHADDHGTLVAGDQLDLLTGR